MIVNKWIHFAMSMAIVLFSAMAAFDWTTLVDPATAAKIVAAIGLAKLVLNALNPASDAPLRVTGDMLVTHKEAA